MGILRRFREWREDKNGVLTGPDIDADSINTNDIDVTAVDSGTVTVSAGTNATIASSSQYSNGDFYTVVISQTDNGSDTGYGEAFFSPTGEGKGSWRIREDSGNVAVTADWKILKLSHQ